MQFITGELLRHAHVITYILSHFVLKLHWQEALQSHNKESFNDFDLPNVSNINYDISYSLQAMSYVTTSTQVLVFQKMHIEVVIDLTNGDIYFRLLQ